MSASESFLPENTFLVTINLQLSFFKNKFKWSFCHFCCKTKTQQWITLCGKSLTLFLLIWYVATYHYPCFWLLKRLSIQKIVQHVLLFDTEIWDMGCLTQTQTHPACSHWLCHCKSQSFRMPRLLCLSCFSRWQHCSSGRSRASGVQCLRTGILPWLLWWDRCALLPVPKGDLMWQAAVPARGKGLPMTSSEHAGKKLFRRHFCPRNYLEVWNKSSRWNREWKQAAERKGGPLGLPVLYSP